MECKVPKAASRKQYKFMMAILNSKNPKEHPRGNPPKSIASKYSDPGKGAPDSKNNDRGGSWSESKKNKHGKGKDKKKLKKAFEEYYRGQGAGTVVVNDKGEILVGDCRETNKVCLPGGHVDPGEDFDEAARRELREETGVVANDLHEIGSFKYMGNDSKTFFTDSYSGKPKDTEELKNVRWVQPHLLADEQNMRTAAKLSLQEYFKSHMNLKKSSLSTLVALEKLEKNVVRGGARSDIVLDVSHGQALRLVGTGCFRFLKQATKDMTDEDFKEIQIGSHTLLLRRHMSDVYSGRVSDGHKVIHQFTNKSLPELCADIMSIFEWYSEEDEDLFDILDEESLPDEAVHGGLTHLAENYTKHNLANIYNEMETIRDEIRHSNAVDLQQVEDRMMKLFDKLEDAAYTVVDKHNELAEEVGTDVEQLESRLKDLAAKVDELSMKPESVEAYQSQSVSPDKVYDSHYFYLPKPQVEIEPTGKVKISFDKNWSDLDKSNFLSDMKAKMVKNK